MAAYCRSTAPATAIRVSATQERKAMTHRVAGIDHVAVTVADVDKACQFYIDVLGGEELFDHVIGGKRLVRGIRAGGAMLSVHQSGNGVELVAAKPTVGAVDICFRWNGPIESAEARLAEHGIKIVEGPVPRFSNDGTPAKSVYFNDLDGNLLELLTTD
jgi:catechol 2,3-dioxygenase-like lactoylglutathione lyase family enzyme